MRPGGSAHCGSPHAISGRRLPAEAGWQKRNKRSHGTHQPGPRRRPVHPGQDQLATLRLNLRAGSASFFLQRDPETAKPTSTGSKLLKRRTGRQRAENSEELIALDTCQPTCSLPHKQEIAAIVPGAPDIPIFRGLLGPHDDFLSDQRKKLVPVEDGIIFIKDAKERGGKH